MIFNPHGFVRSSRRLYLAEILQTISLRTSAAEGVFSGTLDEVGVFQRGQMATAHVKLGGTHGKTQTEREQRRQVMELRLVR